jgi:putative nucleotidyltransferase with HDIG domain
LNTQLKTQNTRADRRSRSVLLLSLAGFSVILAAVTIFLGTAAAIASVTIVMWAAVFRLSRALARERRRTSALAGAERGGYDATISVLCGALGLKDDITASQVHRICSLTAILAEEMSLRQEEAALVQKAAILHDVGKIGISESVLSKRGAFTEDEWTMMKRHPEAGATVLGRIPALSDVADIVKAHHERFDGQGYPKRLRGQEIPLASRIFSVVDAYVAMTTPRPYRKVMPHDLAVKEIVRNSLTQFDPEVVRAFLAAVESGRITGTGRTEGNIAWAADPLPVKVSPA